MVITAVHVDVLRSAARFDACLASVSADRRAKVAALRHREDRQLSLCAALALDACLRTVGLCEASEPITRTAYGKPQLSAHPQWQFSLSHSGEWAVCALDASPVGIDIERRRPLKAAIAERYFSSDEAAYLNTLTAEEREKEFFRLWTAKESLLKAMGTGLSGGMAVPIGCGERLTAPSPWKLREYALDGYALTVCGQSAFPDEITFSSCDSVLPR